MSYSAFVDASIRERQRSKTASRDRTIARQREVARAKQIVLEHLPDLEGNQGGYVDGPGVDAVLRLRARGEKLTEAAIRAERSVLVSGRRVVSDEGKAA